MRKPNANSKKLVLGLGYDIVHPCYAVDGFPMFVATPTGQDLIENASGALSAIAGTRYLRTYYGASEIDFTTFAAHEARTLTKRVSFEPAQLAARVGTGKPSAPPEGWAFAVCDALQTSFLAPERHWRNRVSVLGARTYLDLVEAAKAADTAGSEYRPILIRHETDEASVPASEMAARAEAEKPLRRIPEALQTLEDDVEFRSFG